MKSKILIFLLLLSGPVFAQTDSIDILITKHMTEQKIIGLSLGIVRDGNILVNKGYGLANMEHNVPVKPNTVFRLASVSKQFIATAIMILVQEGKISLEDNMHRFFKNAPETWKPIQILHLLSHTSGLVREPPAYDNFKMNSDIAIIQSAYPLPIHFNPGEKYQYCNLGYYMLAEIITQVSGMPWQDYIHQELFIPAGMTNSFMTDFYPIIPDRASGYVNNNGKFQNAEVMIAIRPSGGFLSTTTDMIKWDRVLQEKKLILNESNWEKLWNPFIKESSDSTSKAYYGFGLRIDEYKGHKTIGHGGTNMGFKAHYTRFPNENLSIIILTNTQGANPEKIIKELADFLLK